MMEWLSQNWIWLVLVALGLVLMTRRGGGQGACCGGDAREKTAESAKAPPKESPSLGA